jgi:hypothetical protein
MEKIVAKLNIEHFRRLLTEEMDESKRAQLQRLLAEEEAKLQAILKRRPQNIG